MNNNKIYTLQEYINEFFGGNQAAFARAQKKEDGKSISRPQVTQWINKNFIVVDGALYSHRRDLEEKLAD
jgi:hypothetical protein